MKRFTSASLLFAFFTIPTSVAQTITWQGPYVGAYLGGGQGNNHASTNVGNITNTSYFINSTDTHAVNNAGTSVNNPDAVIAGIQLGHDWVWKQLVYGMVFDYGTLPLNSSEKITNATYPDSTDTYSIFTSISTNWLFTLRGRLGYQSTLPWTNLLYLTGGMAITQLKVKNSFTDNSSLSALGGDSTSENMLGWTLGAGIELASFNHTTVSLEYLYIHMPALKTTGNITNAEGGFGVPPQSLNSPFPTRGQFHANLIKIELNYRFDE